VGVGNASFNLADLLATDDRRLKEAEEHYQRGYDTFQHLTELFANQPYYIQKTAEGLTELGGIRSRQKDWKQARSLLQRARKRYDELLRKVPANARIQMGQRLAGTRLAAANVELGLHGEAAAEVERAIRPADKNPAELHAAAGLLARCVPLAEQDEQRAPDERIKLARSYADRSVVLLQRAVANGYHDAGNLRTNPAFAPVRQRDDFQALLRDAEDRARPAKAKG
jgi:hypothetical protein